MTGARRLMAAALLLAVRGSSPAPWLSGHTDTAFSGIDAVVTGDRASAVVKLTITPAMDGFHLYAAGLDPGRAGGLGVPTAVRLSTGSPLGDTLIDEPVRATRGRNPLRWGTGGTCRPPVTPWRLLNPSDCRPCD